jgi:diadenylate cyclase
VPVNSLIERLGAMQFTWRDSIDIVLVAIILYNILALIRGTRAMQMTIGLVLLASSYFVAQAFDLPALEALSREILFYLPFAIIVLFQLEIRRALARVGANRVFGLLAHRAHGAIHDPVLDAAFHLAENRIGALIVIERSQSLRAYIETGKAIDGVVSWDLLVNIFTPGAPLHDGAVIIQGARIAAAGAFLPLPSAKPDQPISHGTRHHAAVGLTEETDAFVIVISEENGQVAASREGRLFENLKRHELARLLDQTPDGVVAA